jgi:hypothetical protein
METRRKTDVGKEGRVQEKRTENCGKTIILGPRALS